MSLLHSMTMVWAMALTALMWMVWAHAPAKTVAEILHDAQRR